MIAFGLHTVLHLDPSVVAMMGAGAMVLVSRTEPEEFLEEVEWDTLAFFMALFVLVGSLVQVGVIGAIGEWAAEAMGDRELLGATALLFGSGVIGAFVDNIPYTTATVPIVEDMVADDDRRPVRTARCGGRSSSARTSAATPPRSPPAPTSSCSASPPRRGSRSASGASPGTASW